MSFAGAHGINYTRADSTTKPKFSVLDLVLHRKGLFQYCHAAGAVAAYAAVKVDNDGEAAELTTTITGDEPTAVGALQVALADNEYGWAFRGLGGGSGSGIKIKLAASCAQDVRLYTTATAGVLDDSVTDLIENVSLITTITSATSAEVFCPGVMIFVGG